MNSLKLVGDHHNNQSRLPLKMMQFIALLLMGIELGVSYSHLLQLAGKAKLSLPMFIAVQNILLNKYNIGVGVLEIGSFLVMAVILWLSRTKLRIFRFTLAALLMLVAAFLVWAIWIEPINAAINTWTSSSFPTNWIVYRDSWHLFHLVRLVLLTIGTSSLIVSVLVKET